MKKILFSIALLVFGFSLNASAQPRPAEKTETKKTTVKTVVPQSFGAKYEGGMFGFEEKEEGTLRFDDENERLVFFGKDGKENFSIPYSSMLMVYTGTKSVRSATGTAVSVIPLPGAGLAGLIREKRRYLTIQFSDPDVEVSGIASFKIENDKLRESIISALGEKAELTQRGDAYYRPKKTPL